MLDVTDDPATPLLVWSGPVTSYSSNTLNGFTVGSELGVGLEGGFPYIGGEAEGGIGAEVSIMPDIQVIHDQLDFGFDLMLQRGHTYRLQLAVSVSAHNRVHGGSSIASFFSPDAGGPVVPNVLNVTEGTQLGTENTAFSLLTKSQGGKPAIFRGRVGNYGLTKGDADLECGSVLGFSRTIWEQGLNDPFNKLSSSEADSQQRSDKFLARISGTSSGTAITPSILVGPTS
jgi:hypothetical protein